MLSVDEMVITQHISGGAQVFERSYQDRSEHPEGNAAESGGNPLHVEIHGDVLDTGLDDLDSLLHSASEVTCFGCSAPFIEEVVCRLRSALILNFTCCSIPTSMDCNRLLTVVRFDQCVGGPVPTTGLSAKTVVVKLPCDYNCYSARLHICQLFFIDGRHQNLGSNIDYRNIFPHRLSGFHGNWLSLDECAFGQIVSIDSNTISISGTVRLGGTANLSNVVTTCASLNLRHLFFEDTQSFPRVLQNQRSIEQIELPVCRFDELVLRFLGSLPKLQSLSLDVCTAIRVPNGVILPNIRHALISTRQKRWLKKLAAILPNAEIFIP